MTEASVRVIAVDWSGKKKGASEAIWFAEAADGQIDHLENGLPPAELLTHLNGSAAEHPRVIVGYDFAFSMPAWYVERHFATRGPEFWKVVADLGESWLATHPWPFFGLKISPPTDCELFRETEKKAPGTKSTFLINGPGAVGVGSIRGMPFLLQLREAGWKIWPFDPPGFPMAIEIYPRLLTGKVNKSAWRQRLKYLETEYGTLEVRYKERAAGSEDAFDAGVSALVMARHLNELITLPDLSQDSVASREGWIWRPEADLTGPVNVKVDRIERHSTVPRLLARVRRARDRARRGGGSDG